MDEEQSGHQTRQRIDKWLFFARMAKSRSIAQNHVQSGHVRINGAAIRQASHMVKPGDKLELSFDRMDRILVVKSAGDRRGPYEEAKLLYDDQTPPREKVRKLSLLEQAVRQPGAGRPTKKERRELDKFISTANDVSD